MIRRRRGAAGQQYAIVVGLVAVVAIAAITSVGGGVKALMTRTANVMNTAQNTAGVVGASTGGATTETRPPYNAVTFTACGATGATGPTQSQCNGAYASTPLAGAVTVTAGLQAWVVPYSGLYTLSMTGAAGGQTSPATARPGYGGRVDGKLALTAGQTVHVSIGQVGPTGDSQPGGFGGGGRAGCEAACGLAATGPAAGGGASDIRVGGSALSSRVAVAAGGGGASKENGDTSDTLRVGGHGGGLIGSFGFGCSGVNDTSCHGGGPGTQDAGGSGQLATGNPYYYGTNGQLGLGGNGGENDSGGGGGGYYGGGGGANNGAGGGGSSYIGGMTDASTAAGVNNGPGSLTLTLPP